VLEMTELKTLKDLTYWEDKDDSLMDVIQHEDEFKKILRQEAIKWIKELDNDEGKTFIKFSRQSCNDCISWIKHFFNITEDDLK